MRLHHVERPRDFEPVDPRTQREPREPSAFVADLQRLEQHFRDEARRLRAEARAADEAARQVRPWAANLRRSRNGLMRAAVEWASSMPRHRKQPAPVFPIALVFEGKAHSGSYSVESNVVTVRSEHGSAAACCKEDAPHGIAEHVLRSILTRA